MSDSDDVVVSAAVPSFIAPAQSAPSHQSAVPSPSEAQANPCIKGRGPNIVVALLGSPSSRWSDEFNTKLGHGKQAYRHLERIFRQQDW